MLYMIIERRSESGAVAVYRRFRERGRQAPEGLSYVSSWVTTDLTTCYRSSGDHFYAALLSASRHGLCDLSTGSAFGRGPLT